MTCCQPVGASPDTLARSVEEERLLAVSTETDDGLMCTEFVVPAMHCASCIRTIEGGLSRLSFVSRARANLSQRRVSVWWQPGQGNALALDKKLTALGFDHAIYDPEMADEGGSNTGRQLLLALAIAGFSAANIMLLSVSVWSGADATTGRLFHLLSGLIAAPAIIFAGRPFFRSAFEAVRGGRLNMDVPISLAVLLAFAMSLFETLRGGREVYFDAAVTLLFFLLIGRYLDHMMRDRARNAAMRLARLAPHGASRIGEDGKLEYVAVQRIAPGMKLRVAPGERLPVDGRVAAGASDVDRSLVTGEAAPLSVAERSEIEAGTLNLTGALDIIALRDAEHSFLADVLRMMAAAEQGRGKYVRIADRMAAFYAPAVHMLALLAFVGWMLATGGDWHYSVYVSISVLIVTCPCALGLAVPVVHVIGAARLFEGGILMKDGSSLERLAEADRVLFDKTGTLTTGMPKVERAEFPDHDSAAVARALAMHSNHPASLALRGYIDNAPATVSAIRELPGFGVDGIRGGRRCRLGRGDWVGELASKRSRFDGPAFCVEPGEIVPITLAETLRDGALDGLGRLAAYGIPVEIVSGDGAGAVARVASQLGIDRYSGSLTPSEKIERIKTLQRDGCRVLMVGDGLNDAPALSAAHVSFAPASASDAGRLAADFVFTRGNLSAVVLALDIAKRAAVLVRQNFGLAVLYNCIAVPLALAGMVTPLLAAIAMSASSVLVVANSTRLNLGAGLPQGTPSDRADLQTQGSQFTLASS